jgi:hypothetical protein
VSELSSRPVSAQTRLAWSDFARMGTEHHGVATDKRRWLPAFAQNDEQLRAVLMRLGNRYLVSCGGNHKARPVIDDWKTLEYRCTEHALNPASMDEMSKYQASLREVHKQAIIRAGGYLACHAAVAYRYWRLEQGCIAVAEVLGITPTNVRQIAHKLVSNARALGFETHAPHWTKGKKYEGEANYNRLAARYATLARRFGAEEFELNEEFKTSGERHVVAGTYTRDLVLIEIGRWNDHATRSLRAAVDETENPKRKAKLAAQLEAKNREIGTMMGYELCVDCRCRPIHFARSYIRCTKCL